MNFLSIISLGLGAAVLVFAIATAGNTKIFLDMHAILIVLGGSLAASAIAFQIDRVLVLFKVFLNRVLRGRKTNYSNLIAELSAIADAYRLGSDEFERLVQAHPDFFLKEAMAALQDDVLKDDDLIRVLKTRVNTIYQRQMEEVVKFKTIGKYPPAFGLMGTTLSMITLLQKLGEPGGQKLIGPAMALGLVATFYGLAASNLVFTPVSENLADSSKETKLRNQIIVEAVRLMQHKQNAVVVAEELNSFVLPSERIDWRKAAKSGGKDKEAA